MRMIVLKRGFLVRGEGFWWWADVLRWRIVISASDGKGRTLGNWIRFEGTYSTRNQGHAICASRNYLLPPLFFLHFSVRLCVWERSVYCFVLAHAIQSEILCSLIWRICFFFLFLGCLCRLQLVFNIIHKEKSFLKSLSTLSKLVCMGWCLNFKFVQLLYFN